MKKGMFKLVALLLVLIVGISAASVSAKITSEDVEEIFITEDQYKQTMEQLVDPYLEQYRQTGFLNGAKNLPIYYECYEHTDSIGTIVICHGLGEYLVKYNEIIYYFHKMGYSVYGIESRGQARSGRLGADEQQISVDDFDYYLDDLKTFLDAVVVPKEGKEKLYLFTHSLGGTIGARFLEEYTDYFKAAILSSPMLEINSGDIPDFFVKLLAYGMSITPWKNEYVKGQGPLDLTYNFSATHTHSEPRYERDWRTRVENVEFQTGGATYQWLSEAYCGVAKAISKQNASKVKIPVLLFQAGQDALVSEDGQNQFAKYAADCTVVRVEDAKHVIYYETDVILKEYLEKVFTFFEEN